MNRILRFVPYKKQLISRYKHLRWTKNNTAAEAAVLMKSQYFSAHNPHNTAAFHQPFASQAHEYRFQNPGTAR